jgi:hypothetical protein
MATVLEQTIERQDWLRPIDTGMTQVAEAMLDFKGTAAQKVRNALHGTWLGHPLHPILTDVPIGVWTAATVLDLQEIITGNERLQAGTDAVIGVGLVGAVGPAVSFTTARRPIFRPATAPS